MAPDGPGGFAYIENVDSPLGCAMACRDASGFTIPFLFSYEDDRECLCLFSDTTESVGYSKGFFPMLMTKVFFFF